VHVIELDEPSISGREVRFSWTVTPTTPLYECSEFHLRFPASVELARIPRALWWRIALLCLHAHWPLLRPCRVVLPVRLPEGEAELWLRLTDAAVASLEAACGGEDTERSIEIVGSGPVLVPPAPLPAALSPNGRPTAGGVVSCYSGGRDGTVQAAMLSELGEQPVLVTVTSPGPWSNEHDTPRRRQVVDEITRRRGFEVVEVSSDMRGSWQNHFAAGRYPVSVNELTDTLLYLAAAVVVGASREARLVMMASEAEVQENVRRGGMVVQMKHFMYSAVTHKAVSAVFASAGLQIGSLTNSLYQFQVQRLLSERYADLRDLQYSCWELGPRQAACSRCQECRGNALNLVASGVSPEVAGINLVELLVAHEQWRPGDRYVAQPAGASPRPGQAAGRAREMQELRCLAGTPTEQVANLIDASRPPPERRTALAIYTRLRDQALAYELDPEPGYRAGYLDLLDDTLRDGVRAILDQHLAHAPRESYAGNLARTRLLAEWITTPLARGSAVSRSWPSREAQAPATVSPGAPPISLSEQELERIRSLVPAPEPRLEQSPDGRLLRVAETILDGNELAYLTECVNGNWISSAGPFVAQFEQEFAAAFECRFAVACSSGTAALHLATAAAGICAGDEVLVPAFTMIATANAPRYLGADPVLVDADAATWNLDPEQLGDKLTRRTRAVVAVHTYGQPADMDPILRFARDNGLVVIEDAAEAHGARYRGHPVGSIGDVAAFSLYGNKILTTGEGGVVTTNDEAIAQAARELRDHAFSPERHFWHRRLGFNYRMTNLQAAVGLAQVERREELVARRLDHARRYRELLRAVDGLQLPPELEGGVMWMFGVTVSAPFGIDRDELRRRLAARGVETRTFFVPLHLQPIYYRRFAGQRYPVAEELGRTGLYLPSGPRLSEDDIAYVAGAIRAAAGTVSERAPSSA
jgi:perosamine synthetase